MRKRNNLDVESDSKMELVLDEAVSGSPAVRRPHHVDVQANSSCTIFTLVLVVLVAILFFITGYLVRRNDVSPTHRINKSGDYKGHILTFIEDINATNLKTYYRYLTAKPHHATSKRNDELANYIESKWKSYHFDQVKRVTYDVLLSFPNKTHPNLVHLIDGQGNINYTTSIHETPVTQQENSSNVIPPFASYIPSKTVEGDVVFAGFGSEHDFFTLNSSGVDITDKIVLARLGKVFRGEMVENAHKYGAKGILLYSDPAEVAADPNALPYPNSWWLPEDGVQRGGYIHALGDPLTPLYPAKDGVYRLPLEDTIVHKIPAHPISFKDAKLIFKELDGKEAPINWEGNFNITYRVGPGFKDPFKKWKVRLEVHNVYERKNIHNIVGIIKGSKEPDRLVLLGNHRDAWTFGGVDPSSGTACTMEITRALSKQLSEGWRPHRTLVFLSWGAEEYGLMGSYEWVEDHGPILRSKAVAYFNLDSPIRGNYTWEATSSPILYKAIYEGTKKVSDPIRPGKTVYDSWLERKPWERVFNNLRPIMKKVGTGSDFAPFYHRTGIAVADFRYMFNPSDFFNVKSFPVYHTLHDTFEHMEKFLDPEFKTSETTARVFASIFMEIADTPLLPVNVHHYALFLKDCLLYVVEKHEKTLSFRNISLVYLSSAIETFSTATQKVQKQVEDFSNSLEGSDDMQMRMLNDKLFGLERAFIVPEGLPGRPIYKHIITAPSKYAAYNTLVFPGIQDAIIGATDEKEEWALVEQQIGLATFMIESAASYLSETV